MISDLTGFGVRAMGPNRGSSVRGGADGVALTAQTTAWQAAVIANGGDSPSLGTLNAIDTFWKGAVGAGLDSLMVALNFVAPDSLIAASTPYVVGPGSNPWSNGVATTGFVAGDLTINGLSPGAAYKAWDTGVSPSVGFASVGDVGLTMYISVYGNNGGFAMGSGRQGAGQNFDIIPDFGSGFGFFFECFGSGGGCPDRTDNAAFGPAYAGYLSCNRTSASATGVYKANSGTAHAVVAACAGAMSASVLPTDHIWAFSTASSGSAWNGRASFFAVHRGLSSAQSATFYGLIQALRMALGGGFV